MLRLFRTFPLLRLVLVIELLVLAWQHLQKLSPKERRRLGDILGTVAKTRTAPTPAERNELTALVRKMEPLVFAKGIVHQVAPLPAVGKGKKKGKKKKR